MDKKYQVFISSTFKDLQDERQEVIQAILELDCIPSGMELFPAANETQWEIIKEVIRDCDYYILILAGRYGSLSDDGISYTEKEYDFAVEIGKPIIAFTHKDIGKIISEKTEDTDEGKEKLNKFKEKVETQLCKHWDTAEGLGSAVSRSMIQLIKKEPGIGWVRGDQLADDKAKNEILNLKKENEDLKAKLLELSNKNDEETSKLSQGDERLEIHYSFSATNENYLKSKKWSGLFTPSWNEIIANVFPVCIDEANERKIRGQFNYFIRNEKFDNLQKDKRLKGKKLVGFEIEEKDFHTIIIQLRALNIIDNSTKNRSVRDKSTYWTLTDNGNKQLVMLRAIKSREVKENEEIKEVE
ncbi:MAG: DUF4062 domain-containing protein [Methanobrevibacter sp.]|jgi:hypothetical protein|nr:DUF4062 domain-containing protein [Candidatus Methanoflexus mossambicus]